MIVEVRCVASDVEIVQSVHVSLCACASGNANALCVGEKVVVVAVVLVVGGGVFVVVVVGVVTFVVMMMAINGSLPRSEVIALAKKK